MITLENLILNGMAADYLASATLDDFGVLRYPVILFFSTEKITTS